MKLVKNNNLSEEALREIEAIPVLDLRESGIIKGDLLSLAAERSLLEAIRKHGLLLARSLEIGGRKMIL